MQKIYKYRLPRDGEVVTINDHVIDWLHVGLQDDLPTAWGVVDLDDAQQRGIKRSWDIVAWGTGWDLPDEVWMDCDYIGTCEDRYGYVWHYFARMNTVFEDPREEETLAAASAYVMPQGWSDSFSVTVDKEALERILGNTEANWSVMNDTITYVTSHCADPTSATAVTFARQ